MISGEIFKRSYRKRPEKSRTCKENQSFHCAFISRAVGDLSSEARKVQLQPVRSEIDQAKLFATVAALLQEVNEKVLLASPSSTVAEDTIFSQITWAWATMERRNPKRKLCVSDTLYKKLRKDGTVDPSPLSQADFDNVTEFIQTTFPKAARVQKELDDSLKRVSQLSQRTSNLRAIAWSIECTNLISF